MQTTELMIPAMTIHQRESFLSRIIAGYTILNVGHKIKVTSPTLDLLYEGNEIFNEVYEQSLDSGLIEDEECLEILINEGVYTQDNEIELTEIIPKHIEYWQKELYNCFFRSNDKKLIRKYLAKTREEQLRLYSIRHSLDQYTALETANFARYQYIIENTTYNLNGVRVDWNSTPINKVIELYNKSVILPERIREISHTTPWSNHWVVCKANGQVFPKSGVELNISQQLLILWSRMYDNIAESPDCPPDEILNDDDSLDGWLLIQREKKGSNSDSLTIKNEKIANCENIYIMAQTTEDARKIDNLNSAHTKAIKNSRLNYINKVGKIDHMNLPDVKMDAQMQARNMYEKNR